MIAISYRREDSTGITGRVYDRLQTEFGKPNVFMDFDSIPYGVDFREHIAKTLDKAKVVLVIIGPEWVGQKSRKMRRIDDPGDFVRIEVACALQRGIPIIPVLVNNARMPASETLPKDISELAFRNGLVLDSGIDFHHHTDRLIAGIRTATGAAAKKTRERPVEGKSDRRRKQIWLAATGLVVVGVSVAAVALLVRTPHGITSPSSSPPPVASPGQSSISEPAAAGSTATSAILQINGDSHGQTFEFVDAEREHHQVYAPGRFPNIAPGYGQMIVVAGDQTESVFIKSKGVTSWTYSQTAQTPAGPAPTRPVMPARAAPRTGKLFAGTWRGRVHEEIRNAAGSVVESSDSEQEVVIDETETKWKGLTGGAVIIRNRTLAYNGIINDGGRGKQQLHANLIVRDDGVTATYTKSIKPVVGAPGQRFTKGTLQKIQ